MQDFSRLLDKLVCTRCAGAPLQRGVGGNAPSLHCGRCGAAYNAPEGVPDFAAHVGRARFPSTQWAMEFGPLVAVYEKLWRPMVTLPFSDVGWEMHTVLDRLETGSGSDVLDLACGTGNFTRRIAAACPSGTVVGADLSWPMLERGLRETAGRACPNVSLVRVDVTQWPFAKECFDRVHCAGALHLFPQLDRVFAAIRDTLRPGGIFVGATYCVADGEYKQKLQRHVSRVHGFHWFEPRELRALVEGAGLTGWHQSINREAIVFRVHKEK